MEHLNVPPENHVKVLNGQGWVGLIDHLGSESTIVNAARVSFGKLKQEMDQRDVGLLEYLIDNKHTSPLEHLVFTFSIHCPLFIRGQWHRHRTWSYNEISRRYTEIDMEFYTPAELRRQSENNRQLSSTGAAAILDAFRTFDQVWACLDVDAALSVDNSIPAEIEALAVARVEARKAKNWAESDRLRDEIKNKGYVVEDVPGGGYRLKAL